MRILALIPGSIGNQILFFPTLDTLKTVYPEAKIDVVVEPRAVGAYRVKSTVSDVLMFDFSGRTSLADWGNLLGMIRDREYEIAIAPKLTWSLSFLLWLSGIPSRIGFSGSPGGNFLTAMVTGDSQMPDSVRYHALLQPIGITQPSPEIAVNLPKADLDWADGERKRLGIAQTGYVALYSMDAGYPVNSWESILQEVEQKQPDLKLILLQDASNPDFSAALKDRIPTLQITQPRNLGQQIALLAGASLVISTEGDVLQASIASQSFTLGLFGSGNPAQLMPQRNSCLGIQSSTGKLTDIPASLVLEKLWNG